MSSERAPPDAPGNIAYFRGNHGSLERLVEDCITGGIAGMIVPAVASDVDKLSGAERPGLVQRVSSSTVCCFCALALAALAVASHAADFTHSLGMKFVRIEPGGAKVGAAGYVDPATSVPGCRNTSAKPAVRPIQDVPGLPRVLLIGDSTSILASLEHTAAAGSSRPGLAGPWYGNADFTRPKDGSGTGTMKMVQDRAYPIQVHYSHRSQGKGGFRVEWNWPGHEPELIPENRIRHSAAQEEYWNCRPEPDPATIDRSAFKRISGKHVIVHGDPGQFAGWPANNGLWSS